MAYGDAAGDDEPYVPTGTFGPGNELLERAASYLSGSAFLTDVECWTLDHAKAFFEGRSADDDGSMNSHTQFALFEEFRRFIDSDLVGGWLENQGLTYSDFTEASINAVETSAAAAAYIEIFAASFEFPLFVQIMRVTKMKLDRLGDPRDVVAPSGSSEGKGADITVERGAGAAMLEEFGAISLTGACEGKQQAAEGKKEEQQLAKK